MGSDDHREVLCSEYCNTGSSSITADDNRNEMIHSNILLGVHGLSRYKITVRQHNSICHMREYPAFLLPTVYLVPKDTMEIVPFA